MSELDPYQLTWAALLGRWVEFARSAVALPSDDSGRRMRDSVPDVIMLQAVWFALQHLDELDADERALGLDRAEVLIDKHHAALCERWKEQALPRQLQELVEDARQALRRAGMGNHAHGKGAVGDAGTDGAAK